MRNRTVFDSRQPTMNGDDDGFAAMGIDRVLRVEEDSRYSAKMETLCAAKKPESYDLKIEGGDIIRSSISYAFNHNAVVSFELIESGCDDIVGFVDSIDGNICKVRQIDEYGYEDGFSYVEMQNISWVSVMSEDEKRVKTLWENNKTQSCQF